MQQQQQYADYDLLAVFPDEAKAEETAAKLRKAGFEDNEVYQLEASIVKEGQFRDHGPSQDRREFFLQTQRTGPNPLMVVLLAVVSGLILGALSFTASLVFPDLPEPTTLLLGIALGLLLGALIGLVRGGRVRGNIGQDPQTSRAPVSSSSEARTVIALRFPDPENISRKSRARAILLNNGGRIDRSVGRKA
jgi:hypothetical protein